MTLTVQRTMQQEHLGTKEFYEKNSHLHKGNGRTEKILCVDRKGSTVTVYLVY